MVIVSNEPPEGSDNEAPPKKKKHDPFDYEAMFTEVEEPAPTLKERLSGRFTKLTIIVVAVVLIAGIGGVWGMHQFDPPGRVGSEVTVEIPKGATVSSMGSLLAKNGVVPNALAFRIWYKIDGNGSIQAGEYAFRKNSSAGEALAVLRKGPKVSTDRLTIREGLRVSQIAQEVGRIEGLSAQKFYDLATSGTVRSVYQPDGSKSLEGLLFPDTYLLSASDTEESILRRMVNQFDAVARSTGLDKSLTAISHSPYETLIIASLIEAEAKLDEDRPKVSQVIENRLYRAMPLQFDTTVLYGMGNTKTYIDKNDTKLNSPYNTYAHIGLPPTPINNPGRKAILAALQPTPGPWLYFVVTDKSGATSFAETYEQHEANVKIARSRGIL